MRINKKYYPYPVLTSYSDDIKNSLYETNIKCERSGEYYKFKFTSRTSNSYLSNLIAKTEAVYCIHLECSTTAFRKEYSSHENKFEFSIPIAKLKDTLEICTFIVADKDIENYQNPDASEDYENASFSIEKGCVLAVGESSDIKIPKITDELTSKDSIFIIIRSDNPKDHTMKIDSANDRLKIILPTNDFNNYNVLKSDVYNHPILNSMIIVPALIFAIQELKSSLTNQSDWADKKDLKWVQTIQKKVELETKKNFEDFLKDCDPFEYSQELIGNPVSTGLDNLAERISEDDSNEN